MKDQNTYSMAQLTANYVEQSKSGELASMPTGSRRQYKRKEPSKFELPSRCRFKMTVKYRYGTPLYNKHEKRGGKCPYHSYDLHGDKPTVLNEKRGYEDLLTHVKENIRQIHSARIFCSTDDFPDPRQTDYHLEVWKFYRKTGVQKNTSLTFRKGSSTKKLVTQRLVNFSALQYQELPR